jgi:uracil-DNA glycosylase
MMPEGPEVRTVCDQLQGGIGKRLIGVEFITGRYTRHGPPDGYDDFVASMTPSAASDDDDDLSRSTSTQTDLITDWNCKGKFMYVTLDNGAKAPNNNPDWQRSIWITLGMTGRFVNEQAHARDNRNARWYFTVQTIPTTTTTQADPSTDSLKRIYYHDARNFGTLKFCLSRDSLMEKLASLGPDILKDDTMEDDFVALCGSQKPELNICRFLMNQQKISGVGNYILSEGLYRAGVDPFASVTELDDTRQRLLFRELQSVATESYCAQGLTREKGGKFRGMTGEKGQYEFQLQCYGKQLCARGRPVIKEVNGPHGRTIWYIEEQLFRPRDERALVVQQGAKRNVSTAANENKDDETVTTIGDSDTIDTAAATKRLLKSLKASTWQTVLDDATRVESFQKLASFLEAERRLGATIFPPEELIFSALDLCPFQGVRVVIVGQDPYHGVGQGHGLAFSVRKGVKPPPSLNNIFREAMDDVGIEAPRHGNLEYWAKQGVLLLNTVLTVRQGEANSHANRGWEDFTDAIIQKLDSQSTGLVFLLWGNPAAKKASGVDPNRHTIIRTSHPSPLGATKTASPFLGSKCFSRANKALVDSGKKPIDWNIDP